MNVIDKILSEWSFRCHDGIVDMNNPKKVSILNEILIEEGIDDDIVDAVLNLPKDDQASEEKKQKALAVLTGTSNDEKNKEIEQIKDEVSPKDFKTIYNRIIPYLQNKGLPQKEILALISTFVLKDEEEDLIKYYESKHQFDINSSESILKVPVEEGLKKDTVEDVYKMFSGGAGGGKGVGKEEYFLVAFYNNVKKEAEGDLTIGEIKYEIKGNESMVSPYPRGSKPDTYPILDKLINNIKSEFPQQWKIYSKEIESIKTKSEKWVSSVANLGNTYFKNYIKKYLEILENALREIYKGITLDGILENNKINDNLLAIKIAQHSIDKYNIDSKEQFIFVSDNGEIKVIPTKEKLKELINNDINIVAFSDLVPRLTYKGINTFAERSKLSAPETAQQKAKETDEKREERIAQEPGTIKLKQKLDQANEKLEKWKKDNPNKIPKPDNTALKDFQQAEKEYNDYVLDRKKALFKSGLAEDLTNYLIKSFK
jgi:hypothetical protein